VKLVYAIILAVSVEEEFDAMAPPIPFVELQFVKLQPTDINNINNKKNKK
jgi:hypothetical protein